jgi:hypothetical protein
MRLSSRSRGPGGDFVGSSLFLHVFLVLLRLSYTITPEFQLSVFARSSDCFPQGTVMLVYCGRNSLQCSVRSLAQRAQVSRLIVQVCTGCNARAKTLSGVVPQVLTLLGGGPRGVHRLFGCSGVCARPTHGGVG